MMNADTRVCTKKCDDVFMNSVRNHGDDVNK